MGTPQEHPYKQSQRQAEQRSRMGWRPQVSKDRKLARTARGDLYAANKRGDLLKISKPLTGRARRLRQRIINRADDSLRKYPLSTPKPRQEP